MFDCRFETLRLVCSISHPLTKVWEPARSTLNPKPNLNYHRRHQRQDPCADDGFSHAGAPAVAFGFCQWPRAKEFEQEIWANYGFGVGGRHASTVGLVLLGASWGKSWLTWDFMILDLRSRLEPGYSGTIAYGAFTWMNAGGREVGHLLLWSRNPDSDSSCLRLPIALAEVPPRKPLQSDLRGRRGLRLVFAEYRLDTHTLPGSPNTYSLGVITAS